MGGEHIPDGCSVNTITDGNEQGWAGGTVAGVCCNKRGGIMWATDFANTNMYIILFM